MSYVRLKTHRYLLALFVPWLCMHAAMAQDDSHDGHPPMDGEYMDLGTLGMSGGSSHTGHDGLVGGRTAITTEAVLAYNRLRHFVGLPPGRLVVVSLRRLVAWSVG